MKKVAAILFLCLLLFNLYGYQVLFNYLQAKEERFIRSQISNDIPNDQLISFKVAVHMPPYTPHSDGYEWVTGEVEIDGTIYKYVKRKILKDSVEFLCLPHTGKMQIESAREQFFKLCNDLQTASHQSEKPASSPVKPVSFECVPNTLVGLSPLISSVTTPYPVSYKDGQLSTYCFILERPPNFV